MRLAVISPFLDRSHGTERCIIEQLERLPKNPGTEIHIYAQRMRDLKGVVRYRWTKKPELGTNLYWHKIPAIPGPHLVQYIFWFFANCVLRLWDSRFRGLKFDLIYSPGINGADADAVVVHIVFHEFYRQVSSQLRFSKTSVIHWPRLLHRHMYYRLIMTLEKRLYRRRRLALAAVSSLVKQQLDRYFQRQDARVIRNGVDTDQLSVSRRVARRLPARDKFGISSRDFVLLFIGNDWKKKGLDCLIRALAGISEWPWKLLVVGTDVRGPYEKTARDSEISGRISFLKPSFDVLQFYAAADAYVSPSLEDSYGMPVLEAMACGLPVVSSSHAGVSEIITNGVDGIVLRDPEDVEEISVALKSLISSYQLCDRLGGQAALTAQNETWSRNAQETWEWLNDVLQKKKYLD